MSKRAAAQNVGPFARVPLRAAALGIGLLAFTVIVLSIALWAAFGNQAGTQRGLVVQSEIPSPIVVRFADGQSARLRQGGEQRYTFVVRREDFPSTVTVTDQAGGVLLERELTYEFLADSDFRISVDRNGFYSTTVVRDTPVPAE